MAKTLELDATGWNTVHSNVSAKSRILYKTFLEDDQHLPDKLDRYNDVAGEIQRLIKLSLDANEGFRATGARWSLNDIAHHTQRMHFNENMNLKFTIGENDMHQNSAFKKEDLFFFECGNKIKEVNEFVRRGGKSLKTCGASNGQTIAGALSTGVHGSALDVGAVQDFVVGINLIIGPGANDIIYLERGSEPALNDLFASNIKARVIRDDELFYAAVVGLGSFGFIHGIVVETENLYLLNRYVRKIDKNVALRLATTMNFSDSEFNIPTEVEADGKPGRPYHYKIFINPYNDAAEYVVEIMYKHPFRTNYPDPIPRIETALYKDLILLFGKIAAKFRHSIPKLIKLLEKDILPKVDDDTTGTLGEIFDDAINQGPAFACAFGIDHKDSERALNALVNLTRQEGPIPGIYAMRFIKSSKATLAFSKFPVTCMIEIDGVQWKGSSKMISLQKFCERMIEVLMENDIAFTIHWGKNAAWGFPALAEVMYGDKVATWKQQRSKLLTPQMVAFFSNDFMKTINL